MRIVDAEKSNGSIHRLRRFTQIVFVGSRPSHLICENLRNLWKDFNYGFRSSSLFAKRDDRKLWGRRMTDGRRIEATDGHG
jgi:hypothetical protein